MNLYLCTYYWKRWKSSFSGHLYMCRKQQYLMLSYFPTSLIFNIIITLPKKLSSSVLKCSLLRRLPKLQQDYSFTDQVTRVSLDQVTRVSLAIPFIFQYAAAMNKNHIFWPNLVAWSRTAALIFNCWIVWYLHCAIYKHSSFVYNGCKGNVCCVCMGTVVSKNIRKKMTVFGDLASIL